MSITDEERRHVAEWAADCAERVLPLFEAEAPSDTRPRDAIDGARTFARGEPRTRHLQALALAAHAAAREVDDPAATAAARAAGTAGATAFTHQEDTLGTLDHVVGAAMFAALARELAAGGDTVAADEEIGWAVDRASSAIRELVRRIPPSAPSRRRRDALRLRLDEALRR